MRIAIAGFSHESNTFASMPTTLGDFEVVAGPDLIAAYADTFHELAGFIAGAAEYDFDLAPLMGANATPAGPVTREAYESLVGRLLDEIRSAQPIDGLLLALHGAMVAEEYLHADAETVRRVREVVGSDFPLIVTHDYHGNVPADLVEAATALVIYKTNPHIDQRERGLQAASIMERTVRGQVSPVSALVKPDLLFNIAFHNTSLPPMQPLMQAAIDLEKEPGILAVSVAAGYQYADVPAMGPSIVVVADGDVALARVQAQRLGDEMWNVREQLLPALPDPARAVQMAMESRQRPLALFDLGDNIGGGSAGDSTFILEELLAQGADGWVVTLFDPEAVETCAAAGIGASLSLEVGGKTDGEHGPIIALEGRVRTLHDGSYEERERRHGGGRYFDQGLTAVLEVNRSGPGQGGLLLLTTLRAMPNSIHQITSLGIQPQQQAILVAKGAVAPRAAYEPFCERIIEVASGGATAIQRGPEDYRHARRTLYEWTV